MTFEEFLQEPASKKITMAEIDTPLSNYTWLNYQPGIWYTMLTPGGQIFHDDFGNAGVWSPRNDQYFNIESLNVNGELYSEVDTLAECIAQEETWFYDTATTYIYIHFEFWNPSEIYTIIAPGAIIGFTNQIDNTTKNYFEDIYYSPVLQSVPNLTKKKDSLFFGILQFQGGDLGFGNVDGAFDFFSQLDLYGQPIRVKQSFEGLPFEEARLAYSGRVGGFVNTFTGFRIKIADIRKLLSRKLPINSFNDIDYPSIEDKLIGIPIPLGFGYSEKAKAYKTSAGNWKFCDTEFNLVDAPIIVYKEDDTIFSHGGTVTDGTFTGVDTDEQLTVSFTVDVGGTGSSNGLDTIANVLENYEKRPYNSTFYDVDEWEEETLKAKITGLWIGEGNLKSSIDIIQQICVDNQGIFDVLADGKFTFRTLDVNKAAADNFYQDELMNDPEIIYDSNEYLSSVKIEYLKDLKEKLPQIYTNLDFQDEVFARYRQYKERTFKTALTSLEDAESLSIDIMDQSKFIYPKITLRSKIQKLELRILDNVTYTLMRQNGSVIIPESLYQVLSVFMNLSEYQITNVIKYIKEEIPEPIVPTELNGSVYGLDVYGFDVYGL